MFNSDTDLLFPPRVIPTLRDLRGKAWRELVDRVVYLEPVHIERLAFVLLMIKLGGCTTCQADSFRALRGCTQCAYQTIRRYRGSDDELLHSFDEAKKQILKYLE